jgi:hypothetical protein
MCLASQRQFFVVAIFGHIRRFVKNLSGNILAAITLFKLCASEGVAYCYAVCHAGKLIVILTSGFSASDIHIASIMAIN